MKRSVNWTGFLFAILFALVLFCNDKETAKAQTDVDLYVDTYSMLQAGVNYHAEGNVYIKIKARLSRPLTFNGVGSDVCIRTDFTGAGYRQIDELTHEFVAAVNGQCSQNNLSLSFLYDGAPVDIALSFQYNNSYYSESFHVGEYPPVEVAIQTTTGRIGKEFWVPIMVYNLIDREFATMQATVKFNPSLYSLEGTVAGEIINSAASVTLQSIKDGEFTLGIRSAAASTIQEDGVIVYLVFKGLAAGTDKVELLNLMLDEGNPESSAAWNMITVEDKIFFDGQVTFADTGIPVPGVSVRLNQVPEMSTTTGADGFYTFTLPYGSSASPIYTREGDDRAVTAFDAALAERCALGMPKLGYAGECYMSVVDVTGDGQMTLLDSWYILRYSVGYRNETNTGKWVFSPGNMPLPGMVRDTTQNQKGHIIGDISLNWSGVTVASATNGVVPSITFTATTNQIVVTIEGKPLHSAQFTIANNAPTVMNSVKAEGFDAELNGNGISISSGEVRERAVIIVDANAQPGSELIMINLQVDEVSISKENTNEATRTIVGPRPEIPPIEEDPLPELEQDKVFMPSIFGGVAN